MKNYRQEHEFLEMQAQETDDCILWPYGLGRGGYGIVRVGPKCPTVHRLSCILAHGEPPTSKHETAHSCRNRHCFNPRHLRWATRTENERDKTRDGVDNKGIGNGRAKLSEFDVMAIRHYASCGTLQQVLADHYRISVTTVSRIVRRLAWTHIEETRV